MFGNDEFLIVNALETPLLGFYWCPLWVVSGCPAEPRKQASHFHVTSHITDEAMPALLGLEPPADQNLPVRAGQNGLEECWGGS